MRGFTLIELMVTIAVLAIIIGVAVPSFVSMTHRNRLAAASNEVVAVLQSARMEAVRRNRSVTVCPTADGATCSGSDWSRVVVRTSAAPIRETELIRPNSGVSGSSFTQAGAALALTGITYRPDGRATAASALPVAIGFVSSRLPANQGVRLVEVNTSRISVCRDSNGDKKCAGETPP
ncbi:GspH/FimT family pseudopilin [Lysobacter humi (ex Lee et al. 2017)]